MGNMQGYVKIQENEESTRHLIKLNQFRDDRNWSDIHVYDFQNNEYGCIKDGKYEKASTIQVHGVGECYYFSNHGKLELYLKKWFLKDLKDGAVEHVNKAIATKNDEELINLR